MSRRTSPFAWSLFVEMLTPTHPRRSSLSLKILEHAWTGLPLTPTCWIFSAPTLLHGVRYRHECEITRTWDEAVVGCDHTTIQQAFNDAVMGVSPQIIDEQAVKDQCKAVLMDYDPLAYATQRKAFAYHHPFAFPSNAVFVPPRTAVLSSRRRIQTDPTGMCIPYQIIAASDFEDRNVDGWINGRTDYAPAFSTFLGCFGNGGATTAEKTFTGIPTDVEEILFEYDMYEIDRWDKTTSNVRIKKYAYLLFWIQFQRYAKRC